MAVFGIFGTETTSVASSVYYGLYALQHRGQASCGIVVNDDGVFHVYKDSDYKMDASVPGHNWWGEGDEKFFVDGEKFPSWFGTGTEDFFGYAWCDPTVFTAPYHGQSHTHGRVQLAGNRVVTRVLMADSVAFSSSFEGCLEKYYADEHVRYAFTSHFYLKNGGEAEREKYSTEDLNSYFELDS